MSSNCPRYQRPMNRFIRESERPLRFRIQHACLRNLGMFAVAMVLTTTIGQFGFAAGTMVFAWHPPASYQDGGDYQDLGGYQDGIAPLPPGEGWVPPDGMNFDPGYPIPPEEVYEPAPVDHWFSFEEWSTSFEAGLNGSAGNSDTLALNAGFDFERTSDLSETKAKIRYSTNYTNDVKTQDFAILKVGHEWFFPDSPWSAFINSDLLYDQFRAFEFRFVLNGGVAYTHFKNDIHTFKSRYGAGIQREFGGPDDSWVPEALFGVDYTRKLSKKQKLNLTIDYFPEFGNFSDYRLVTDFSWELLVDEEANLSLKLNVTDQYDSTPNGAQPNDINYALLLLWKL